MARRVGLGRPVVMLVTDRRRLAGCLGLAATDPAALDALVRLARDAALAGVDLIQIRESDLDGDMLAALVRKVLHVTIGTPARVIVNERLDVALACGASGVHLPERGLPPDRVRFIVPPGFLVGRSVHDSREVSGSGILDYLVFGPIFETRSKPKGHVIQGVEGLEAAVTAAGQTPVVAIGGIALGKLHDLAKAGAAGIAAVDLFLPSRAPHDDGRTLAEIVNTVHEAFDTAQSVS